MIDRYTRWRARHSLHHRNYNTRPARNRAEPGRRHHGINSQPASQNGQGGQPTANGAGWKNCCSKPALAAEKRRWRRASIAKQRQTNLAATYVRKRRWRAGNQQHGMHVCIGVTHKVGRQNRKKREKDSTKLAWAKNQLTHKVVNRHIYWAGL